MQRMIRWTSVLMVAVALFAAVMPVSRAVAAEPPRPAQIRGLVSANDAPVAGAAVVLVRGDRIVARTRTNDRGAFAFERVLPGRYIVRAGKEDVGRGQARTLARPGETSTVRINLSRG